MSRRAVLGLAAIVLGSAGPLAPSRPAPGQEGPPAADTASFGSVTITPKAVTVEGRLTIDLSGADWTWTQIDADEPAPLVAEPPAPPPPDPGRPSDAPVGPKPDAPAPPDPASSRPEPPAARRPPGAPPDVRLSGTRTDGLGGIIVLVTERPLVTPETRDWFVSREIDRFAAVLPGAKFDRPEDFPTEAPARWSTHWTFQGFEPVDVRSATVFGRPTVQVTLWGPPETLGDLTPIVERIAVIGRDGLKRRLPDAATLFPPRGPDGPPAPPLPRAEITESGLMVPGVVSIGQPAGPHRWTPYEAGDAAGGQAFQWGDRTGAHVLVEVLPGVRTTTDERRPILADLIGPKLDLVREYRPPAVRLTGPRRRDPLPEVVEVVLALNQGVAGETPVVAHSVAVFGRRATYVFEAIGDTPADVAPLLAVVATIDEVPPPTPEGERPAPAAGPAFRVGATAWPPVIVVGRLELDGLTVAPPSVPGGDPPAEAPGVAAWSLHASADESRDHYVLTAGGGSTSVSADRIDRAFETAEARRAFAAAEKARLTAQLADAGYVDGAVAVEEVGEDVRAATFRRTARSPAGDPLVEVGRIVFGPVTAVVAVTGSTDESVAAVAARVLPSVAVGPKGAAPAPPGRPPEAATP